MNKWRYKIRFTDKREDRIWEVGIINNAMNFKIAKEMAEQYASEFFEGKLIWMEKLNQ